jgi:hypothetical protein
MLSPLPAALSQFSNRQKKILNNSIKDCGALQALLTRFETQRLPRILRIKQAMDTGAKLEASDLAFLHEVLQTASQIMPLIDRNPDFQELYTRSVMLYYDITTLALENEMR